MWPSSLFISKKTQSFTLNQVVLDWAYAEIKAPRWRARFMKDMGEENFLRINSSTSLDDLYETEKDILITAFRCRRGWLLDRHLTPATDFRLIKLGVKDLGNLRLMPEMKARQHTMLEYARSTSIHPERAYDPRNAAEKYLATNPPLDIPNPPIIAQGADGVSILLEGYVRTIGFLRMLDRPKTSFRDKITCIAAIHDKNLG